MSTPYETVKAAHEALCLDAGFDPFLHGGAVDRSGHRWKRPSRVALAALGYPVDAAQARRVDAAQARREEDRYECDYGHVLRLTQDEAAARDYQCPHGHHFV